MNIYELRCGALLYYVAANDEEHATDQGQDASRFPDMHFLPFSVKMIEVEGVTITATHNEDITVVTTGRGRRKNA